MTPNMWKLEYWQLITRIQANQFRYLVRQFLWFWFLSAVVLIVYSCGSGERKEYAGTWVVATVTTGERVVHKGEEYNRVRMLRWLDRAVYQGTLWEWAKWIPKVSFLPVGAGCFCWLLWFWHRPPESSHVRGAEIVSAKDLQLQLRAEGEGGIVLAGVQIPKEIECQHISACGATGTGKSVAIRDLLKQFATNEEVCIIVDPHGEASSQFYNEARGDWWLNPIDMRCPTWTPQLEGETEVDVAALAAALFRIVPGQTGPEVYYHKVARRAYRKLMGMAAGVPVHEIPDLLQELVLSKRLRLDRPEVLSTMQNALDPWRYLRPGARAWSAKSWVANPQGWCFLTFRQMDKAAVLPIISLWFESLIMQLLSMETLLSKTIRIVIDELAELEQQPALDDLLSQVRKRGVSVVIGFQDVAQLYVLHGKDRTHSMLNQPLTQLFFRSNNAETQAWCAANTGEEEVITQRESETAGPADLRDAVTRTNVERTRPTMLSTEFGQLRDLHGILKVGPFGMARVQVAYSAPMVNHPVFLSRKDEGEGEPSVVRCEGEGVKVGVRPILKVKKERRAI
jgi:hypothetical protein